MNCNDVCEKMYDYIENQLSQQDLKAFEEHMKNCTYCQQQYEQTEKLLIKLKNIKDIEPPKHLKYKILENIKKEQNPKKIIYFKKYSYVAATIAIFICSFYTLKYIENYTQKATLYTNNQNNQNNQINQQKTKIIEQPLEQQPETQSQTQPNIQSDTQSNTKIQVEDNQTTNQQIEQSTQQSIQQSIQQQDLQSQPKIARSIDNEKKAQTFNQQILDNESNDYFYTKNITKDDKTKIFKHDIALYKNYICNVYFENNDNQDIILYVEDINGNKVSPDTLILKNDKGNMQFYMTDENFEQDVFTIVLETKGENLNGLLNIEILQN